MNNDMQLLIIYDETNFDNKRFINFLMKNDSKKIFCYASLQSYIAQILVRRNNLQHINAPMLVTNDKIYTSSDAIIRIVPHLDSKWRLLSVLRWLPRLLREKICNMILTIR